MISVVGAVIMRNDTVLAARRGPQMALPGLWEFPGGKVEHGESLQMALVREIEEEVGCTIKTGSLITKVKHHYEFASIELTTFYARIVAGVPIASEHSELKWLPLRQLYELEWAPADLPTVDSLATSHA